MNRCTDRIEKVINLHYTERCNYRCRFCHSRFGKTPLGLEDWKKIIGNILHDVTVPRFNLAGGEPLAAPYVQELVDFIHELGIDVSIITNGSYLSPEWIRSNRGKISMIGISVDALTHEQNVLLGRVNEKKESLSAERLSELASEIHRAGMKLKINTVVNSVNCSLDFTDLIRDLAPERWKLLRMIQINGVNDGGKSLLVSDREFADFVARHRALSPVVEDTDDIVNAYIVVNPFGELINNSGHHYTTTESLLDHGFLEEFSKIPFREDAYRKRY